jgi:hypothetical protein
MASVFRIAKKRNAALHGKLYVELLDSVDGIPQGIYEVFDILPHGFMAHFKGKVLFGVEDISGKTYRFLSQKAPQRTTSLEEFLVCYWHHVEDTKKSPSRNWFIPEAYSFCFMDSSLVAHES